jgi:hypothetical protein
MIPNPLQYTITRLRRVRLRPAHSPSDFRVRLGAGTRNVHLPHGVASWEADMA